MNNNTLLNTIPRVTDKEFVLISDLIYKYFGIRLTDKKKSLLESRLNKLLSSLNVTNYEDFYNIVINDTSGKLLLLLVDKISTNHTYFFRENDHLEFLKKIILAKIKDQNGNISSKKLRIWSAGCSSGEECYSIAMIVRDLFNFDIGNWDIGILGTDISVSALYSATQAEYDIGKYASIKDEYKKYAQIKENKILIRDEIKNMVTFRRLNLIREKYPFSGKFDVIFCRNVMIYFDDFIRKRLIENFYDNLNYGGYLIVGHSETLSGKNTRFKHISSGIYKKSLD